MKSPRVLLAVLLVLLGAAYAFVGLNPDFKFQWPQNECMKDGITINTWSTVGQMFIPSREQMIAINGILYLPSLAGAKSRVGNFGYSASCWSEDGKTLTLANNDQSFQIIDTVNKTSEIVSNKMGSDKVITAAITTAPRGQIQCVRKAEEPVEEGKLAASYFVKFDLNNFTAITKRVLLPAAASWSTACFTPDRSKILFTSIRHCLLWDVEKEEFIQEETALNFNKIGPRWSADGGKFVLVGKNILRLYSADGKALAMMGTVDGEVMDYRWTAANKIIIVMRTPGNYEGKIYMAPITVSGGNILSGEQIISTPFTWPGEVAWTFTDGGLVVAGRKGSQLCLWNQKYNSMTSLRSTQGSVFESMGASPAHFSPDGRYCATVAGSTVSLFDSRTCQLVSHLNRGRFSEKFTGPFTVDLFWTPDSKKLIVNGQAFTTVEFIDLK